MENLYISFWGAHFLLDFLTNCFLKIIKIAELGNIFCETLKKIKKRKIMKVTNHKREFLILAGIFWELSRFGKAKIAFLGFGLFWGCKFYENSLKSLKEPRKKNTLERICTFLLEKKIQFLLTNIKNVYLGVLT